MVDDNEIHWRMVRAMSRLPEALQEAITDLAEALAEGLEKVESPNRADTPEE